MKIQDILFFAVFALVVWKRSPQWSVIAGLLSLLIAIPLFATWTFFTAERLTWYAAAFFLLSIILQLWKTHKDKQ